MDPEERDELKENDLASWLQFGLWNFLKQNGSYLLLALALTFLGYQLWSLHKQRQLQELWTAWADLHAAEQSPDSTKTVDLLLEVIDKHKQPAVQAQAYLTLGNIYDRGPLSPAWLQGQRMTRDDSLDKSFAAYQSALDAAPNDPLIAGYAHLGLGAVDEDRGDWDKARQQYQLLTGGSSPFTNTPMAVLAQARITDLDNRKASPRLAALIPPPPPPSATPNSGLNLTPGSGGGSLFPGIGSSITGSPVITPQNSPSGASPYNPFGLLSTPPPAGSEPAGPPSTAPSGSGLPSFLNFTPPPAGPAAPAPAPAATAPATSP